MPISIQSIWQYPHNKNCPERDHSRLKSRDLWSGALHTTYYCCLCNNNVQWLQQCNIHGAARACSHAKLSHFIGIYLYLTVSRMIFWYFIVTLLSNSGCRYQLSIMSFRYPGPVSGSTGPWNRQPAIIWTNADLIYWYIYAALGGRWVKYRAPGL